MATIGFGIVNVLGKYRMAATNDEGQSTGLIYLMISNSLTYPCLKIFKVADNF